MVRNKNKSVFYLFLVDIFLKYQSLLYSFSKKGFITTKSLLIKDLAGQEAHLLEILALNKT